METITDKTFTGIEEQALKSLVGRKLLSVEADGAVAGNMALGTVSIRCEGLSLDVRSEPVDAVMDEFGNCDEFGGICISESIPSAFPNPAASRVSFAIRIDETIQSVEIAYEQIRVFGDGELVAFIKIPQAIILNLDHETIAFDREAWFSDTVTIKRGGSSARLVYDDVPNWADVPEEDPSTRYEVEMAIARL